MKTGGMTRKIDDLGRVVIPAEMRKGFGLKEGDKLDISIEADKIILSKQQETCIFCGSIEDLKEFKGRMVCATCIHELTEGAPAQSWEPFSAE